MKRVAKNQSEETKFSSEDFFKIVKDTGRNGKVGSEDELIIVQDYIYFTRENYPKDQLYLINIVFEAGIDFSNLNLGKGVVFEFCEVKSIIRFENCESSTEELGRFFYKKSTIGFSKCQISELYISCSTLENGFIIHGFENELSSVGKISFQDSIVNGSLKLEYCVLESSFSFFNGKVQSGIHFSNAEIGGPIRLSPNECREVYFRGEKSIYKEDIFIMEK